MKLLLFRYIIIAFVFMGVFDVRAQTAKQKQIADSISNAYHNMQNYHMHVQTNVSVSGKQIASQVYDIYKHDKELYLTSGAMEMLYNASMVLMVLKDQKQLIVRPVTEKELERMKKFEAPALDTSTRSAVVKKFSETEQAYLFTADTDKGQIVRTVYSYGKKSFLLEKVDISYADTEDNQNQRSVITYTYAALPLSAPYFDSEKYLIKTQTGYTAAAAYSNYFINMTDSYEK